MNPVLKIREISALKRDGIERTNARQHYLANFFLSNVFENEDLEFNINTGNARLSSEWYPSM